MVQEAEAPDDMGHGVDQFEVTHDRASPWKGGNGQETRPAAREADGETRKPPVEMIWGGGVRGPQARSLTWTAGVLSSDNCRITANQAGAEVDRTAGGGETWVGIIAMPAERYPASNGRYAVP